MTTPDSSIDPNRPGPLLTDRVAVVTGGAGAIGGAICRIFAAHGAHVVIGDIDPDRTSQAARNVEAEGRTAVPVVADLTTAGGIEGLRKAAFDNFERVDILVNGLGHHLGYAGPFEDSTEEEWDELHKVNLLHVLRASKAFIPSMKEGGWGSIVNFSSVEGIRSAPAIAAYTAYKGAIDSFTKSLAVDLGRHGIRVNAIAVDKTRAHQVNHYAMPEEYERFVPTWIPLGRYGEGEDVARAALFLASDLASWVTGHVLVTDGGTLAAGGWFRTPKRWTNQPLLTQWVEDDPAINEKRPPSLQ